MKVAARPEFTLWKSRFIQKKDEIFRKSKFFADFSEILNVTFFLEE